MLLFAASYVPGLCRKSTSHYGRVNIIAWHLQELDGVNAMLTTHTAAANSVPYPRPALSLHHLHHPVQVSHWIKYYDRQELAALIGAATMHPSWAIAHSIIEEALRAAPYGLGRLVEVTRE